ncbi:heavy metal translocating P-type ATPase [Mechercharimyces sp. CAU 1602]|uniref:heavy metal translocating P-type ATPase n=1 Tax=Mechercharimyces sp. CAU 1602 TaxID=2973933 RepID=UPI002161223E|nr:heavy metal translocating P-type ATPase [Mechercharimyces sp. CAU 1602]MCS1351492.1 heavy metal translocating P-type ATPase [Mechercharimyces sp. CAU 1602]
MSGKIREATMQISGMTCASCAIRTEKGLKKVNGVQDVSVNFALENAKITYDSSLTSEGEFQKEIEGLGYEVVTEKKEFDITGMTCAACATRIEKGLNQLSGTTKVNVNFAVEKATVEYQPSEVSVLDIANKVKSLGYEAVLQEDLVEETDDIRSREMNNQKRRFFISLILSLPLLWSMVSHFEFMSFIYLPNILMNPWVQMALATPVQFIIGKPFYVGAFKALKNKSANMDVLVALGTSAAYFYSVYLSFKTIGSNAHMVDLYFETSAVLITLIILGKLFEARAKGRSSEAIKKLIGLQSKTAIVDRDGMEKEISIEEVLVGDIVYIKPGEKVPVDGEIIEGRSSIDESMITGESIPNDKTIGDLVIGASINKNGFLKVRATKVGKDTALAQIIKVVEEAQGLKAPIQRLADRISAVFVPIVIGIAIVTFLIWYLVVSPEEFPVALEKLIAVLVIACPCALGLATPTSIMAGSGRSAEFGILFKGGEHIEVTHLIDTVVLDKTGTVTHGTPTLTDVILHERIDEDSFLRWVGSSERNSEHPLAQAIVEGVVEKGIELSKPTDFEAIPGYGIKAVVNNKTILIGTRKLMLENQIHIDPYMPQMTQLEQDGKTAMLVAVDHQYAGIIAVADTLKDTSKTAISRLKDMGINVIMITGDNEQTAKAIASQVGIDHVIAEVLPEGKADEVKRLQKQGNKVTMVGDGINDAPALAVADIGMAIGTGTDIAMETADITLIRGDLNSIADAIYMSKKTIRNIKQNLFWAFAYNTLGIPIAAFGFLAPWLAGAAMAFSSVSVVLNSLRLQKVKL